MLNIYSQFWTKAFDFKGSTTRIDFWTIFLINTVIGLALSNSIEPLYYLFSLASICPSLAITIRRIQDTGRSWTWIFIILVPIIGMLWFLYLICKPSEWSPKY